MQFIPVPNTMEARIRGSYLGVPCENTIYHSLGGTVAQQDVEIYAFQIGNWYRTNVVPLLSNQYQYRETYAFDLSSQTGPGYTALPAAPVSGGATGQAEPGNVSFAVSFRTALRGRSGRGRNFIIGLTGDVRSGNGVTPAFANALVAAYSKLITDATLVDGTWVIASRFTNKAPRTTGVAIPVTSVTFSDLTIDTQRRRLR